MTEAEMRAYAARHGATGLRTEDLARMGELAERVAVTGRSIPRMAEKGEEPAPVFRVPARAASPG